MDAALAHVLHPAWVLNPDAWVWRTPHGQQQWCCINWREYPYLFNLMWLSMDMPAPPQRYDLHENTLAMSIVRQGQHSALGGEPLFNAASCLTLEQFHRALSTKALRGPLMQTQPLLKLLADRRMHALP